MLKKTGSAWVCMSKVKLDEEVFLSINNIKRRKTWVLMKEIDHSKHRIQLCQCLQIHLHKPYGRAACFPKRAHGKSCEGSHGLRTTGQDIWPRQLAESHAVTSLLSAWLVKDTHAHRVSGLFHTSLWVIKSQDTVPPPTQKISTQWTDKALSFFALCFDVNHL